MRPTFAFLATIVVALPTWAIAQATLPAKAEVPPAAWNLDGAGKLVLPEGSPDIVALGPELNEQSVRVDVIVGDGGALTSCGGVPGQADLPVIPKLCTVLVKLGRFERDARMELPVDAHLVIKGFAAPIYAPVKPIRFGKRGEEGAAVVIAEEPDGSCSVESLGTRVGDKQEICAAWRAKSRPRSAKVTSGNITLVSIPVNFGKTIGFEPLVGTSSIAQTGPARSSLGDPLDSMILKPEDGQLQLLLSSEDYPSRAKRDDLRGRTVTWLGFDSSGAARSCRPVESTNSAYLANATCDLLLKKARYEFAPGKEKFQGLRYAKAPIIWSLN